MHIEKKVLIVDDDPEIHSVTHLALSDLIKRLYGIIGAGSDATVILLPSFIKIIDCY